MLFAIKAAGKQVRVAPKLKPIKQRVTIKVTLSYELVPGDVQDKLIKEFESAQTED